MLAMIRYAASGVFLLVAAAPSTPAAPAPSPLAAVPQSAPVFVHLRGVEGTKDRLMVMLKKALPELAPQIGAFLDRALKEGEFTDGRKPRGLAKDGPAFFVLLDLKDPLNEPKFAYIAFVTKYEEFRDNALTEAERKTLKAEPEGYESATLNAGEPIFFVHRGDIAIVTLNKNVAKSFTKDQKGSEDRLSNDHAQRLLASDLGVYVSMDAVNKTYADQIKTAHQAARDGLKTAGGSADKGPKSMLALAQKFIDPAFQALDDSRALLLTFEFRPAGLAIHLESELKAGSPTAKALEVNKLSAFNALDGMPAGQIGYTAMESNKLILAALGELLFGMQGDSDDKGAKAMRTALDDVVGAEPGTRLDAYNVPVQGLQIAHFGDPAKALAAQLKLVQALASGTTYGGGILKEQPKVTPKARKHGELEFTSVELTWDLEKMAAGVGGESLSLPDDAKKQLAESFKKLLGEKQTSWVATDGKAVIQVTARGWDTAEKLLDQHARAANTTGANAAYRDVRKELPAEASFVALADVPRYVGLIIEFAKPIIENTVPIPLKLPAAPADLHTTYCGTAISLKADRASIDLFVSALSIHEIYRAYVLPTLGALGGAAN
jgi:hypothetical protein